MHHDLQKVVFPFVSIRKSVLFLTRRSELARHSRPTKNDSEENIDVRGTFSQHVSDCPWVVFFIVKTCGFNKHNGACGSQLCCNCMFPVACVSVYVASSCGILGDF